MSETKVEKKVEKGIAEYKLPIPGLILGIIGIVFAAFTSTTIGPVSGFLPTAETSQMMVVLLGLITAYIKKIRLSWADYAVIFALTYTAPITFEGSHYYALPLWTNTETLAWFNKVKPLVPSFFIGPKDVFKLALKGGTSPPWGALMPYAMTGFLFTFFFALSMMLAAIPFRRQIVEIERIPFPVATASYSAILNLYAEGEEAKAPVLGTRRNWVLVGFIFGFIITAFTEGYLVSTIAPGVPVIPAVVPGNPWRTPLTGIWRTLPGAILAIQFSSMFPWAFISFFFPLEALYSILIGSVLAYLILIPAEINAGWLPSWNMEMSYGMTWFLAFRVEGIKFFFAGVAMVFGAVLGHYLTGLKSLIETWKENPPEVIGKWRTTMYLSFLGVIVFIIVGILIAGVGPHLAVVLFTAFYILFFINLYYIRTIGEVNLMWGVWAVYFMHTLNVAEGLGIIKRGVTPLTKVHLGCYAPMMLMLYTGSMAGVAYMESQRFAFLAKVNPKKVFLSMILGIIIAYFINLGISATQEFQFGITNNYYGHFGWGEWIFRYPYRVVYEVSRINRWYTIDYNGASGPAYWICFILGILLTWGRYALNIPLSAIGLGFGIALTPWDWSYTFIPFLVIKWLMLKVGGGRLYERVGVPFFAGASAGALFSVFIDALAKYYKFLYGA